MNNCQYINQGLRLSKPLSDAEHVLRGREMNLEQISRIRKKLGLIGALFCLVIFFGVVDSVLMQMLKEHFTVNMLPGESIKVNGPMPERIKDKSELTYVSETRSLLVEIERVHTGYWLGGNLWNGRVKAMEHINPGSYRFMVRPVELEEDEAFPVFTAYVYASASELRENSKSFFYRNFGFMPWWLSLICLPMAVCFFWLVYKLSRQREVLLLKSGKADIVRIKSSGDKQEIAFGLGKKQGVEQGTALVLLDESGTPLGSFRVAKAFDNCSLAVVTDKCPVTPGCMVVKMELIPELSDFHA